LSGLLEKLALFVERRPWGIFGLLAIGTGAGVIYLTEHARPPVVPFVDAVTVGLFIGGFALFAFSLARER